MFKELVVEADEVFIEDGHAFFNMYHPEYDDYVYISAKINCTLHSGKFEYGYGLDVQNYKDVSIEHLKLSGMAVCEDVDGVEGCKVGQVFKLSDKQEQDINRQLFNLAVNEKIEELKKDE